VNLLWFLAIFGSIIMILSWSGIRVEKMNQRRKLDFDYDNKITRRIDRLDPYFNFVENMFGWVLAILVIYFIYLG
jgi:hypothetical protein